MDRKSRQLLILHGAPHPTSNVDRLYLPRGKAGRALINCESCVQAKETGIGWNAKNAVEPLSMLVRQDVVVTEECMTKEHHKRSKMDEGEPKLNSKKMYRLLYGRETSDDVDKKASTRLVQRRQRRNNTTPREGFSLATI